MTTTKIRFTGAQLELAKRVVPEWNLGHITELAFEFGQAGELVDAYAEVADGANRNHDYAGPALVALYDKARRRFETQCEQTSSAIVLQFPTAQRAS